MRKSVGFVPALALTQALGATACTTATNEDAADRVEKALDEAKVEGVNVDYDQNARVVHLKGKVDSAELKDRAEQIAETAVGTSGTVLNELTVEGMDEDRLETADDQLRTRLNDSIQAHPELNQQPIDFYVNNGVVTVTGEVMSSSMADSSEFITGQFTIDRPSERSMASRYASTGLTPSRRAIDAIESSSR